ncbi:MAG: NAD(P)-binding domain-containing protein [Bacteroidetes bacterium]|nr:NAD(P)-binding domain-containing protein [Bacteroidota bacterium]
MRNERKENQSVLIVDDFHPSLLEGLYRLGIHFDYQPEIEKKEILAKIAQYSGLIVRSKIECDKAFFEKAKQLKWIAKGGSGIDSIDEQETKLRNIQIINAPEGNRNAVAEHTIGLMLNLADNISHAYQSVQKRRWNREANRGVELEGKVLGIIGFGNIGSTLAKRISGFDMQVLAYDKYKPVDSPFAIAATLDRIFEEADWVSLHIPLTEETRSMVNADFLQKFKKPIGLINASRGKIVVAADVLTLLQTGQMAAFGADVLENEKPANWNEEEKQTYGMLMSMPNVVITPHIAGWTKESYRKIAEVIIAKLEQLLSF